jgi:hypothetical protein
MRAGRIDDRDAADGKQTDSQEDRSRRPLERRALAA